MDGPYRPFQLIGGRSPCNPEGPQQHQFRRPVTDEAKALVELNAHGLKGAVANFSAAPATNCARELEMLGRNRNLEGAAEKFGVLEAEIKRLLAEFEAYPRKVAT